MGLSDRVAESALPTLEQRMDDIRAVMDAAGSSRAVIFGISEGGPLSTLFAATYPARTAALIMYGAYAKWIRADNYPWAPTREEHEAAFKAFERHWGTPIGLKKLAPSAANDERVRQWWAHHMRVPDATQDRLLSRLCRGRHRRRQTSTRLQGATRTDLVQLIRSCFIGRISYLAPTSSRIIGSAAVRRSTSVWSFAEKIDSPHPPLGSSAGP